MLFQKFNFITIHMLSCKKAICRCKISHSIALMSIKEFLGLDTGHSDDKDSFSTYSMTQGFHPVKQKLRFNGEVVLH